jgi:hypothetical protein
MNTAEVGETCYQESKEQNSPLVQAKAVCLQKDVSDTDK